jgi:hypothetical protein
MATDNKSLTIYLETEILDALTAYCLDNGIVRKDKTTPILATGAVDLMKQALGLSPTLTNTVQVRDEQTEKKLENLEARLETFEDAIAKLPTQEDDPTEKIDEVISQLREKEISPILFRLENLEALLEKLETEEAVPFVNETVVTDFDLEVDPPDYSPIFTDPDPIPISDLEQKIRDYILENTGKEVISSNLFRGLDLTNKPGQQQNAKNILERLGCVEIQIKRGSRPQPGWKIL